MTARGDDGRPPLPGPVYALVGAFLFLVLLGIIAALMTGSWWYLAVAAGLHAAGTVVLTVTVLGTVGEGPRTEVARGSAPCSLLRSSRRSSGSCWLWRSSRLEGTAPRPGHRADGECQPAGGSGRSCGPSGTARRWHVHRAQVPPDARPAIAPGGRRHGRRRP